MTAIIDTCIIVDVLQNREPFSKDGNSLFLLCANKQFEGYLTAKAVTDIYYLAHKQTHDNEVTRDILAKLCNLFTLLDTASIDIKKAISSEITDFEDAVMVETAIRSKIDCIVTRNIKDYVKSSIPIYSPAEFLKVLSDK